VLSPEWVGARFLRIHGEPQAPGTWHLKTAPRPLRTQDSGLFRMCSWRFSTAMLPPQSDFEESAVAESKQKVERAAALQGPGPQRLHNHGVRRWALESVFNMPDEPAIQQRVREGKSPRHFTFSLSPFHFDPFSLYDLLARRERSRAARNGAAVRGQASECASRETL
jgi:hypothetical protein